MGDTTLDAAPKEPKEPQCLFMTLPMELYLMILNYDLTEADLGSLARIQKQSSHAKDAAEALLFSSIALPQPDLHQLYGLRLQHLLRIFLTKRHLRHNVKRLHVPHFEKEAHTARSFGSKAVILSARRYVLCLRSRADQTELPVDMNWPVIVLALENHSKTLEHLALTSYSKSRPPDLPTPAPTDISITPLKQLQSLKYLDLDDEAIFGISPTHGWHVIPSVRHDAQRLSELLPPNLEHLVIREGRQYHPLLDRPDYWRDDCYAFGEALCLHGALRRLDAIGFDIVHEHNKPMVDRFSTLLIERSDMRPAYRGLWGSWDRTGGQSTCMTKPDMKDKRPVLEPPWLSRGPGTYVQCGV